ncbi:MAG: DUF2029 domain-containing protein [Chloroflexi bacterium]|nr:DUF2029 domain-containing protein [Chloroflexota bacterium]
MKRIFLLSLIVLVLAGFMLAVAVLVPHSLPVGSDFSALYFADLALVNGIRVYDIPRMEALALARSAIPPEHFFMPRFPYPPWYMLATFYLGLLPIQSAGALWFQLNLVMLFLSVGVLTDGWNGRARLLAFPLALFFLPTLGALSVGQYDFPVLLGIALLIHSLRNGNASRIALGVVLLTFKPHIGGLVLLSVLGWLWFHGGRLGRRAMRSIVVAGFALFVVSLIADPLWFVNYPKMLFDYRGEGNVTSCSECASVPVLVSRWWFDGSLRQASGIALGLLVILAALLWTARKRLVQSPEILVVSVLLVTLLVSPYLYNYDFILLLVPFAALGASSRMDKIVAAFCYLVPSLAIIVYGRGGNLTLNMATLLLMFVFSLRVRRIGIDVPVTPSYNRNN